VQQAHGFCVRRGDVQTWSFVLLFKFSADRQFCAPKPARTQSPKTLTEILNLSILISKSNFMKALVYHGDHNIALEEKAKPSIIKPSDVIVRVTKTTICGTDSEFIRVKTFICKTELLLDTKVSEL